MPEKAKPANRTRTIQMKFFVTKEEKEMIELKMKQLGTENTSAYLRKMAIDGYVIKKDYSELKDLAVQMSKIGTNINQIAHKVNATSSIYKSEITELQNRMDELWQLLKSTLSNQL